MLRIGAAFNAALLDTDALAGTVASQSANRFAVGFDQHAAINVSTERALKRFQIWGVAIGRELDTG